MGLKTKKKKVLLAKEFEKWAANVTGPRSTVVQILKFVAKTTHSEYLTSFDHDKSCGTCFKDFNS